MILGFDGSSHAQTTYSIHVHDGDGLYRALTVAGVGLNAADVLLFMKRESSSNVVARDSPALQNLKMFNLMQNSKLRGSGHLVLNALRALTVVGLVVVMAASWAMIVLSGITGHFDFFDTISHFFVFAISVVLVISELGLFKPWFSRNFPILGPEHSLGWLGLALVIIGCDILADLIKPAYEIENIGLAIWRLVLSAGILSITFGVFNMVASVIFRDGSNGINARQIRSDGTLAAPANNKEYYDGYSGDYIPSQYSRSNSLRRRDEEDAVVMDDEEKRPSAFKRLTTNFKFGKSRPQISDPIPQDPMPDTYNNRSSPIVPGIQRPATALHPAHTGGSRYSKYSEAHMDRF
ncbi:hypothetical protein QBC44DRAFT_384556 [Cladorrhinum sp. PSN332]|nr:hypothetical protein QBC44DRAFT_384556 [Cladorrhinum sp. PSN332]